MNERRNHSLWIGPLLAVFGVISYFTIFVRWPTTRDFPWANLLILAAALGLSGIGLKRAWLRGGWWRRLAGLLSTGSSVSLTALLIFYCFVYSARVPSPDLALAVGATVPDLTLPNQQSRPTRLATDAGHLKVLVFYRGHW